MALPNNVRQLLESRVRATPKKEFLFTESGDLVLTYEEFNLEVNRAARLLRSRGISRGERVSLFLTNRVEYLIFYFACFKIGAWAGPVNAMLKPSEINFVVANSGAALAITEPALYPILAEGCCEVDTLREIVIVGSTDDEEPASLSGKPVVQYGEVIRDQQETLDFVDLTAEDEAVIIYTSGTTGKPKGVLLTHGNLLANAQQIAEWLGLESTDRALVIMPLFHVNALMTTCMAALWAGGSLVLAPRFSASRHWQTISRYGVTYFGSVATMLSLLTQKGRAESSETENQSRLRFALCGSAPVPVEVIRRFESLFGCPVIEGYGLSECTCRATFNPTDARRRPGSIGVPIGNEVKIFDDQDRELPHGEVGEIVLRGPNVMKGYYQNPSATIDVFRSGWLHTGDLGYQDDTGFFYIVDRKSDMIIRAGENIYPREIDEVLYRHPKVLDAATIGVADPLYGEEVKSFVVLRESETATESEILDFCRTMLADFKCPKSVEFLPDIPKGPTGKLLKRELAARFRRPDPTC